MINNSESDLSFKSSEEWHDHKLNSNTRTSDTAIHIRFDYSYAKLYYFTSNMLGWTEQWTYINYPENHKTTLIILVKKLKHAYLIG